MSDSITFKISIPSDDDGYILLRCEHCGTFFKALASDIEDDGLLNLYCPSCGLISEHYLTPEVIELAETIVHNYAADAVYKAFKDLERETKNSFVQFKAGKRPKHLPENPIKSGIEALEITDFKCCHRTAKIKPLLRMTGCYCPFCGVKEYEVE